MEKILIIDSDMLDGGTNYPNLALMKLSGYHKSKGADVTLAMSYDSLDGYDTIFLSKVFTRTQVPAHVLNLPNISYGGTGFDFDKHNRLPYEVEHFMPDYDLYAPYVKTLESNGAKRSKIQYYTDYSIGFMTRGCIRGCSFCVNRDSRKVELHSPLSEFYDPKRKKIALWDDNVLASPNWREIFDALKRTNKRFRFQQGLDFRLLTREKMEYLRDVKYDGSFIFAFDNIEDKSVIIKNLKLWNEVVGKECRFYVFCGYENLDGTKDLEDMFERISILAEYGHFPYIMRHENYVNSRWKGVYIQAARWANQPAFFRNYTIEGFADVDQKGRKKECASKRALRELQEEYPELAKSWYKIQLKKENQT